MKSGVRLRLGGMNGTKEIWSASVYNCNCVPVTQSIIWTVHSVISDNDSVTVPCVCYIFVTSLPSHLHLQFLAAEAPHKTQHIPYIYVQEGFLFHSSFSQFEHILVYFSHHLFLFLSYLFL